jgi:GNAT superfamily N-acetyltransferase
MTTMSAISIGPSRQDEVALLPDIERRAARLFAAEDVPPELLDNVTPVEDYEDAHADGRLFVARDPQERVVGFVHLIWLAGRAHLEELDVEPEFGRQGIGRRLVEAACDWARNEGCDSITLSTFRDVAWNAPFYARQGFEVIAESALSPALVTLREREAEDGLDPAKRVMMIRRLDR